MSPQLMIQGCKYCFKNADHLFESALILEKQTKYGPATSLMILAVEEAIKGFAIYNKFIKAEKFNVKLFFTNHTHKHGVIGAGHKLFKHKIIEASKIRKEFEQYMHENPNADIKETQQLAMRLYYLRKKEAIQKECKETEDAEKRWWQDQNQMKMEGFYVDFKDEQWRSPLEINKHTFNETKKRVEIVIISLRDCRELSMNDYGKK